MKELQELAARLLSEGTVRVVIGYEQGPRGVRPAFITQAEQAGRLLFDSRCVHNLVSYLSPRRTHLTALGKKAIVIKGCDARALAGLIREEQVRREDLVILGVRCGGVSQSPEDAQPLTANNVSPRCAGCPCRETRLADHLLGPLPPEPPVNPARSAEISRLEQMTAAERFAYWKEALALCLRCHACREICPMCYCERCLADKSRPQWIESAPHLRGNLAWNTIRALHLAGRCSDCGECERVCPAGIPLSLINQKTARIVEERFQYRATDDPAVPAPIGAYRQDDLQEFIL